LLIEEWLVICFILQDIEKSFAELMKVDKARRVGVAEANSFKALQAAKDEYEKGMTLFLQGSEKYIEEKRLEEEHLKWQRECFKSFERHGNLGGPSISGPFKTNLETVRN
jgi:hypothetical protein